MSRGPHRLPQSWRNRWAVMISGASASGIGDSDQVAADGEMVLELAVELDLRRTLEPLAHGHGDPTMRFTANGIWRATRTRQGPATVQLRLLDGERLRARAWGPGARSALAGVPDLVGLNDAPEALRPRDPLVRGLVRRFAGVRLPRTGRPFEALLPAILEQKVTGVEARASYRALLRAHGESAPGPPGLRLQPLPATLAGLPYHAFHPLGIERHRAELIRRAAALAERLERASTPAEAYRLLAGVRGIGPWTMAEVGRVAYGDPDALSVGDYHLARRVSWAFGGDPRGTDARMLELLEPYRGQRGRVQRLIEAAGIGPPRRGPRMPPRHISDI